MKPSKYLYFLNRPNGKVLVFNGLTKRFFCVSGRNAASFEEILLHPDIYYERHKAFIVRMLQEGFVLADDADEFVALRKMYEKMLCPKSYKLMVLPTFQCNLRCWYCIQKHQDVKMSSETIKRLKAHIEKYLSEQQVDDFYLSWFGGEPMLEYDVICEITDFSKKICEKRHIKFGAGITSNGTLLDVEKILRFKQLSINFYQITIDGNREEHNRVKRLVEGSAFDATLLNIRDILEKNPEAKCILRINYSDKTDFKDGLFADVNSVIPVSLRKRITVTPRKVWQIDEKLINTKLLHDLHIEILNNGYGLDGDAMGLCYVMRKHFHTVYPNGRVGKCDNNDDMSKTLGKLSPDGDIIWDAHYPFESHSVLEKSSECRNCKHLPICWGPCPKTIDEMLQQKDKVFCCIKEPDKHAEFMINSYITPFLYENEV